MNQWAFVTAAYAITLIGAVLVSLWAWRAASSAETRADGLRERD